MRRCTQYKKNAIFNELISILIKFNHNIPNSLRIMNLSNEKNFTLNLIVFCLQIYILALEKSFPCRSFIFYCIKRGDNAETSKQFITKLLHHVKFKVVKVNIIVLRSVCIYFTAREHKVILICTKWSLLPKIELLSSWVSFLHTSFC